MNRSEVAFHLCVHNLIQIFEFLFFVYNKSELTYGKLGSFIS